MNRAPLINSTAHKKTRKSHSIDGQVSQVESGDDKMQSINYNIKLQTYGQKNYEMMKRQHQDDVRQKLSAQEEGKAIKDR